MRRRLRRKRVLIPVASLVVLVALLVVVQLTGVLFPLRGKCPDWMYPTIPDGGQVLAEGVTYRFRDPHRGEIVRFHVRRSPEGNVVPDPNAHDQAVSLRVIGVPGDTWEERNGSRRSSHDCCTTRPKRFAVGLRSCHMPTSPKWPRAFGRTPLSIAGISSYRTRGSSSLWWA